VFVVEDDPDIRELVQTILEEAGAAVSTEARAEDALPRLLAEPPDLVLMDMSLGALDGFRAAALLRERGFRRPIVACTAFAAHDERRSCLAAGCDDVLAKPLNRDLLITTVRKWLVQLSAS
jgi:CheY-like chemotaxis protein